VLLCICIVIIIIGGENDNGSRIITVFMTKASWKKRWCLGKTKQTRERFIEQSADASRRLSS